MSLRTEFQIIRLDFRDWPGSDNTGVLISKSSEEPVYADLYNSGLMVVDDVYNNDDPEFKDLEFAIFQALEAVEEGRASI